MRKRHFTKQVGLILSEETYDQVIKKTNEKEVTISEWIREAILFRLSNDSRERSNRHFHNLPTKERRTLK